MPSQPVNVGRPRVLLGVATAWCIASLVGLVVSLALMKIDRSGTVQAGKENLRFLWPYWIASASVWMGLTVMWMAIRREAASGSERGNRSHFFRAASLILIVAAAVRIAVLITHQPALSDDVYRYIFEGRTFAAGLNPYAVRAEDRDGAPQENFRGETKLLKIMTYHELATPYLPGSHFMFGVLGVIIDDRWIDPKSSAMVFRIAYTALELGLILLLFAAVKWRGRSPWWVALYAWHQLPISEIAGSGHQDVTGIVLMVGALLWFTINRQRTLGWAALTALATVVKPVAAVAGLFMLATERDTKVRIKAIVCGGAIVLVMVSLFWVILPGGPHGFSNWRHTVGTLSEKWAHFGGVYEPVLFVIRKIDPAEGKFKGYNLVQETWARRICVAALIATIGILLIRTRRDSISVWRGTAAALLAVVLLTPTAHPWYLLWAFALFPMAPSRGLWIASLTLPWGYVVFASGKGYAGGEEWTVQPWVLAAAYLPVFAAIIWDVVVQWRSRSHTQLPSSNL